MAQKKVPPTPQQQHSSSEEQEVEATTPSEQTADSSEETSGEDEAPLAPVYKPTPPVEQHSSSSDDDDEEVEEEVESSESDEQNPKPVTPRAPVKPVVVVQSAKRSAVTVGKKRQAESTPVSKKIKKRVAEDVTPLAPVNKPTPPVEQHSSSSDDSEEEEEEEPNVTPVAPVKPVVLRSPPKIRAQKQQQPDLAPATAVTVGKKRPAEESKAVSKKIKKKRVVEEVVNEVGDYPKTPTFQRVFTEDDEIAILKALLKYSAEKSIHPIDSTDFHNFVKNSIHFDVTKDQLSHKISSMKRKYRNKAVKKNQTFGKEHDKSCYDISEKIWGTCGGSELKTIRKGKRIPPGLQIPPVVVEEPVRQNISWSELAETRDVMGLMCLSNDTFKKNLELLSNDEARAAFEDKLKNIVSAELDLTYKRLELSCELMKSSLDGHRG